MSIAVHTGVGVGRCEVVYSVPISTKLPKQVAPEFAANGPVIH